MSVVSLNLRPGVWKNGTRYQAKGRYYDTNLVRWYNGALEPIGGWTRRVDPSNLQELDSLVADSTTEIVRDAIGMRAIDKSLYALFGSNRALYRMTEVGTITDVSPEGLTAGTTTVVFLDGFGRGFFGTGTFGTPRETGNQEVVPVARWALQGEGEDVLALATWEGTIYKYDHSEGTTAQLANAPTGVTDFVVTDQEIVMTIGDANELRLVQWSDRRDSTEWTPQVDNYASFSVLPGRGRLQFIINVGSNVLIVSETDAFLGSWIGAPYVYSFTQVGEDCRSRIPNSAAATNEFAVWIGDQNFWVFDGGAVKPLECDLIDFFVKDANPAMLSKLYSTTISAFFEIWWFYQSNDADDIDSYIVWNWKENIWYHGKLARPCAIDQGVLDTPVMVDLDGFIYNHELRGVGPDGDTYATTGPMDLSSGDQNIYLRYLYPDTKTSGSVEVSFQSRQMPTGDVIEQGPYPYNNPMPLRAGGRELMMTVRGVTPQWTWGNPRVDVARAGAGRR